MPDEKIKQIIFSQTANLNKPVGLKSKNKTFLAFTLVELIIVIVILAILSTIAFLSFKNYSSSARDSNRMSNVSIISKGIDVNIATGKGFNFSEVGTGMNVVIIGSGTVSYTGYYESSIGPKFLSSIGVSSNDILNDSFQTYKFTYVPSNKYYQVMGLLENQPGTAYFKYHLIQDLYAATTNSGFAFLKGNFPSNTASGGYIQGLIPASFDTATVINGLAQVSGTSSVVLPAEVTVSVGGYITVNGACGTNAVTYPATESVYPALTNTAFCSAGTLSGATNPIFPSVGTPVSWNCNSDNGGTPATCTAIKTNYPNCIFILDTDTPTNASKFGDATTTYCIFSL